MYFFRRILPGFLLGIALVSIPCAAQAQQAAPAGFPDGPGRDLLLGRCFQCHGDAMWRDHRQDRRGWEGVLYRMVGRGALWTEDEINTMAGYLATVYGRPAGASK
jgi:mono/diheme cytochrome c family protein